MNSIIEQATKQAENIVNSYIIKYLPTSLKPYITDILKGNISKSFTFISGKLTIILKDNIKKINLGSFTISK